MRTDRKRLADVRMAELAASAELLGCARVLGLAYADSGLHPDPDEPAAFANQDPAQCAAVLAEVLREEGADVLTVYDANGGYGHPDHVQVHRVGVLAARLAGTPVVLEATVPGRLFAGVLRALALVGHPLGGSAPLGTARVFAHPRAITHRVRVRGDALRRKRAAMAAHGSQRRGGDAEARDGPFRAAAAARLLAGLRSGVVRRARASGSGPARRRVRLGARQLGADEPMRLYERVWRGVWSVVAALAVGLAVLEASAIGVLLVLGLVFALCWVVRYLVPDALRGPHPLTVTIGLLALRCTAGCPCRSTCCSC